MWSSPNIFTLKRVLWPFSSVYIGLKIWSACGWKDKLQRKRYVLDKTSERFILNSALLFLSTVVKALYFKSYVKLKSSIISCLSGFISPRRSTVSTCSKVKLKDLLQIQLHINKDGSFCFCSNLEPRWPSSTPPLNTINKADTAITTNYTHKEDGSRYERVKSEPSSSGHLFRWTPPWDTRGRTRASRTHWSSNGGEQDRVTSSNHRR